MINTSSRTVVNKISNIITNKNNSYKNTPLIRDENGRTQLENDLQNMQKYNGKDSYKSTPLIRDENGYTQLENDLYKLNKGYNITPGSEFAKTETSRLVQEKLNEDGRPYSEESLTERGMIDRIFGMLGYNGIAQGLYYLTDDNEETTLGQGLLEGFKYMNPFTDNVMNRKSMSDVFENMGWVDDDPDKVSASDVARGVIGFAGDVLTDPLSYINPFGSAAKIVKGSGYGLDVVKDVERFAKNAKGLENIKGVSKVADYLHEAGKTNIEKLSEVSHIQLDTIKQQMKEIGAYRKMSEDAFNAEAEKLQKQLAKKIQHIRFAENADEGFSFGLHHLPFMERTASSLKKTIASNEQLTKLGDKTISPYFNTLAKKLRTSRLGQKFSTNSIEAKLANGEWIAQQANAAALAKEVIKGVQKAKIDSDDIKFAQELADWQDALTEEQTYDFLQAVEDGTLKNAIEYDNLRTNIKNKTDKYVTSDGEVIGTKDSTQQVDSVLSGEASSKIHETANKYEKTKSRIDNKKISIEQNKEDIEKFTDEINNIAQQIANNTSKVDARRRLYYTMKNELPGLDADEETIEKLYQLSLNSSDVDITKSMYNYFKNHANNKVFTRLFEKLVDENPKALNNFINVRLKSMSASEISDMLNNYAVKYGDVSDLDDVLKNKVASNPQKLTDAFIKAKEFADGGNVIGSFDWDKVKALVEDMPDKADVGDYLNKYLSNDIATRRGLIDFANENIVIPRSNNFLTNYQDNLLRAEKESEHLENIMKRHENTIKLLKEKSGKLESQLSELTNEEQLLEADINAFYKSKEFEAYREIEKYISEPGMKTKFSQNIEDLTKDLTRMQYLDKSIQNLKDGKSFFANQHEAFDILKKMEDRMIEIADDELSRGSLKVQQVNNKRGRYLQHMLTEEGKKYFEITKQEFNKTGGFKGAFGKGASNGHERKIDGTIKELNEKYAEELKELFNSEDAINMYNTSLADMYIARTLASNQLIYAIDNVNFLKNNFSEIIEQNKYNSDVPWSKLVEDDEVVGVTYHDLNSALNKNINLQLQEQREAFIAKEVNKAVANGESTKNVIFNAESFFDKHLSDSVREEIQRDVYTDFFGDGEKATALFTPNIPFQTLNDMQASKLKKYYNVNPRKIDKRILEEVNVMSKTQKIKLQSDFLNIYDKFLSIWKLNNSATAPSFHVQNAVSNAFQSFLGISADALNPKKIHRAYNILKLRDPKQTFKCAAGEFTYKQLEHIAKTIGVVDEGFVAADLGKGATSIFENNIRKSALPGWKDVNFKKPNFDPRNMEKNTIYQASTVIGTTIESTQRMNHFLSCLEQGMSLEDAARAVDDYLFNYSDLTGFEQNVIKRIIPFYTFMRKNFPMEIDAILNRPQIFSTLDKAVTNIDKMAGDNYVNENLRNEWRQDYIQLPFGSGQYGINLQLPYQQLDRLEPGTALQKLVGSTTPIIKTPVELLTGKTAYTGMDINNDVVDYGISQLGIVPTALYRSGKALVDGDKNNAINNISKTLAFPIAKVKNQGRKVDLTDEEFKDIFEEVYGFRPN